MKRLVLLGLGLGVLLLALLAYSVLRTPTTASEPIAAVPLVVDEADQAAAAETAGDVVVFAITPADSQARFELDEDLRGARNTVVGTTDQIAGQIAFNPDDLATAQIGVIQVNARTLSTDHSMRNRAIQNWILETQAYEYITFTPTAVQGLPASASIGQPVTFTIVGDLTIRDVTQEVAFTADVTLLSESELSGAARTTISRGDYDLTIPNVPQVANVEEEIELILEFVARTV
jgi:polyisoprenoid-binding protein YceI